MLRQNISWILIFSVVLGWPMSLAAETVTVPFGTTVFVEMDQMVTSKKKDTSEGDLVKAHVWKDVLVDGKLVIKAGTPVYARVAAVRKAKIAGVKGKLEIEVLNVVGVDGRDIPLDGGYDKSGKGRMGAAITLAVVVLLPLIFIKGKQAVLEKGALFDAIVRSPVDVEAADLLSGPVLKVEPALTVEVLYDDINPEEKLRELPLRIISDEPILTAAVISANGVVMKKALPITLDSEKDGSYLGLVDFKMLSKSFRSGMNRFEVKAGDESADVLLELEF